MKIEKEQDARTFFRAWREQELGLSVQDFAKKAGYTKQQAYRLEAGKFAPSFTTMLHLARNFGYDLEIDMRKKMPEKPKVEPQAILPERPAGRFGYKRGDPEPRNAGVITPSEYRLRHKEWGEAQG